ncbi:MAG: hypothetical protein R6V04_08620 [bacterium]
MQKFPERDWKKLRSIKKDLLDVACERILKKIEYLINNKTNDNHKTYLKLWKLIRQEDRKIATMFDDPKRSNAIFQMAELVKNDFIDQKTLKEFSQETQERINRILEV